MAPSELMNLSVLTFFIIKDKMSAAEAKYPTHSVNGIPKNIIVKVWGKGTFKILIGISIKKKPHSKMSEENCYEKDW